MPDVDIRTVMNVTGLEKFADAIDRGLRYKREGPIRDALREWQRIYGAFVHSRWDRLSTGGGEWPPLAQSTIDRRRHRVSGIGAKNIRTRRGKAALAKSLSMGFGQVSILRDTETLFKAVDPKREHPRGALREQVPYGATFGFGGSDRHRGGKATISEIAAAHQVGRGHVPARPILVDADQTTRDRMAEAMLAKIQQVAAQSQVKSVGV